MCGIDIVWLVLSVAWGILGVLVLLSFKKIEDKSTRKYVFTQYLITWFVLTGCLINNIFR